MSQARVVRNNDGEFVWPWNVKASGGHTDGRFDFFVGEIGYFSGPPLHLHREQDDTFYILEGILAVQADDKILDLHPGDFVTVPPGVPHTFDNIRRNQRVRAINLMTPGGYDKALTDFNSIGGGFEDFDAVREVGNRWGVEIVGPPLRDKLGISK
ncbi:cupin domain-containing protein [Nocardia sp. NPDC004750]